MTRSKHSEEFEIEVGGEPYVWRLQRRPQWSSDPAERRGMAVAVRHREGQREAVLEFPPGQQPRFGLRQLQASQIAPELVQRAIGSAISAGWEPLSRGKPVAIVVDAAGG
jgi:hypothetical protein